MQQIQNKGISYCSLSSSSHFGNAYVVKTASTQVLIDYGVRLQKMQQYLDNVGVDPGEIDAVFITHEHSDHCIGLNIKYPLHIRYDIPAVYGSPRTWRSLQKEITAPYMDIRPNETTTVGDIKVTALRKPHDAAQPLAYRFDSNGESVGIVTDLGKVEPGLIASLYNVDHIILESNYDEKMERESARPAFLIDRVMGDRGHLSNEQAALALRRIIGPNTRSVLLAHLSIECNTPEVALSCCESYLSKVKPDLEIDVALPDRPTRWFTSTATRKAQRSYGGN